MKLPVPCDLKTAARRSRIYDRRLRARLQHEAGLYQLLFGLNTPMAKIPAVASLLTSTTPWDLQKLLIAAILSSADPDEPADEPMLMIREDDLERAKQYTLVTSMIDEERTTVLSVRLRK